MTGEWVRVDAAAGLEPADVVRFDHGGRTYAVYCDESGRLAATDGLCTHGRMHLADGFVFGTEIECPKHNGRFDVHSGAAKGAPACVDLAVHPVRRTADGAVEMMISPAG